MIGIIEVPTPKNVQIDSFPWDDKFYGRFIPSLSTIAHPLDRFLYKFILGDCNKEYKHTFEALKAKMASTKVLVHYDHYVVPLHMGWWQCYHIHVMVGQKDQLHMPLGPSARYSRTMPKLRKRVWLKFLGSQNFINIYSRSLTMVTTFIDSFGSKKNLTLIAAALL